MRDAAFHVVKKSGLLPFEERGLADIRVYGRGMSLSALFEFEPPGAGASGIPRVRVSEAGCSLDDFDIAIKETEEHGQWMYSLAAPLIRQTIKQRIEQAVISWLQSFDFTQPAEAPAVPSSL